MYPATYFDLFPAFPREEKIFIAISFSDLFRSRLNNIIKPAIKSINYDHYVVSDDSNSGNITTDIVSAIRKCKLLFADITEVYPGIRNANVMYELGLAHAVRPPEDIVIFRSDIGVLPFDIANIRVNSYSPDSDVSGSIEQLAHTISSALKEQDVMRQLAVEKASSKIDSACLEILMKLAAGGKISPEGPKTMGQSITYPRFALALGRLLDLGLATNECQK